MINLGGVILLTKISTVLGYFQIGWNVLIEVKDLVETVESIDHDDGKKHGPEKKAAIMELIEAVYDAGNQTIGIPVDKEVILDLADNAVEVFVNLFNVIGRFRSKSQ